MLPISPKIESTNASSAAGSPSNDRTTSSACSKGSNSSSTPRFPSSTSKAEQTTGVSSGPYNAGNSAKGYVAMVTWVGSNIRSPKKADSALAACSSAPVMTATGLSDRVAKLPHLLSETGHVDNEGHGTVAQNGRAGDARHLAAQSVNRFNDRFLFPDELVDDEGQHAAGALQNDDLIASFRLPRRLEFVTPHLPRIDEWHDMLPDCAAA